VYNFRRIKDFYKTFCIRQEINMQCEFEEKTYEQYHNLELLPSEKIFFPPGQIQEHTLGIDSALFTRNRKFWKIWGYYKRWWFPQIPSGVYLEDLPWEELKEILESEKRFKFNIFLQYKRPEYINSTRGKEYRFWGRPYFRYAIHEFQQEILLNLERRVNKQGLVTYAAPAFYRMKDLLNFFQQAKLIDNSNYIKPSFLGSHKKWTYENSGLYGKAFSEPEKINSFSLIQELKIIRERMSNTYHENNFQFMENTLNIISESIQAVDYFKGAFNRVLELLPLPKHPLGKIVIKIYIFLYLTKIRWAVAYE